MLLWLCGASVALAADWWAGAWGLDPSQSDDPTTLVTDYTALPPSASGAGRFSPDGASEASTATFEHTRDETLKTLSRSGRVRFAPSGEGVDVDLDGSLVSAVPRDGAWVKVADPDGAGKYRLRLWDEGDRFTVERRFKGLVLLETWLAPSGEAGDALAVVVQLDGASVGAPIEFRRVYRRLGD